MNEGKPTRAKWWSRPRPKRPDSPPPEENAPHADGPGEAAGTSTGHPARVDTGPGEAAGHDVGGLTGTDSEAGTGRGSGTGTATHMDADGDYVVRPPDRTDTEKADAAAAAGSAPADGAPAQAAPAPLATAAAGTDAVVPQPAVRDRAPTEPAPGPAGAAAGAQATEPASTAEQASAAVPSAGVPSAGVPSAGVPSAGGTDSAVPSTGVTDTTGAAADGPGASPSERPRPLHDPDPYSTPPYGKPGPWAPAPPVLHPVATPPQGTPLPPPAAPAGQPRPAPPQPYPAASHDYAAPQTPPYAEPRPTAAPASALPPQAGPGTPGDAADLPGADPVAAAGTERRAAYDPWAAPLQQTGAVVPESGGRYSRRRAVLGVVVVALVAGLLGGAIGSYAERRDGGHVTLPQAGPESAKRPAGSVAGIAASALPSVVTIHVRGSAGEGTGTGFVLDDLGHILTNNHVIQPGTDGRISVTFSGGQTADAHVIGHDSGYDLAVVKVSGVSGLKPLPLGNSDNVRVGDPVVAIGAPFDLANTVTSGIISAKERPITTAGSENGDSSDVSYVDALQTDAPINPGNSGGPLVDTKARVIGINSAIRSADDGQGAGDGQSGSIGLGFAIPVNQAKRVAEELINTGSATHPVIGVTLDMDYAGDGARVATDGDDPVQPGGPADRAGIRPGDVISQVDGRPVHSGDELIVKVRAHRPGDRLALTVRRSTTDGDADGDDDGKSRKVTLVLGEATGD